MSEAPLMKHRLPAAPEVRKPVPVSGAAPTAMPASATQAAAQDAAQDVPSPWQVARLAKLPTRRTRNGRTANPTANATPRGLVPVEGDRRGPAPGALRTPRQRAGDRAEAAACAMLQEAGLHMLARNVRTRDGEIDLVFEDGETVVFVEVRMRQLARFGGAAASVDRFKQNRIVRCAQRWLLVRYGSRWPACRFDVVSVDGGAPMQWLRNAFGAPP